MDDDYFVFCYSASECSDSCFKGVLLENGKAFLSKNKELSQKSIRLHFKFKEESKTELFKIVQAVRDSLPPFLLKNTGSQSKCLGCSDMYFYYIEMKENKQVTKWWISEDFNDAPAELKGFIQQLVLARNRIEEL